MCDEHTVKDAEAYLARTLSRRQFNAGLTAAMLASATTTGAGDVHANVSLTEHHINITTPDGDADAYLVHPKSGRHPAVVMWPDIMGIRPAFRQMGQQLAEAGYTVLVVNPYYRTHSGDIIATGESVQDPDVRTRLMPHRNSLTAETCVTDGLAYIDYLDGHNSVDNTRPIGVAGYCMTGSYGMYIAAASARVGVAASFHGGGLVTDAANSPHRLLNQTRADILVAIAENDHDKEPHAKDALIEASQEAGLNAEIEVYQGALHGWCPLDSRVYNKEQAERAWGRLLSMLNSRLKKHG